MILYPGIQGDQGSTLPDLFLRPGVEGCISKPFKAVYRCRRLVQNGENWQYKKADGQMAAGCWEQDENGLTYHLDGNGNIERSVWWETVAEIRMKVSHMITSVTRTINGTQYTFDDKGNMIAGSEKVGLFPWKTGRKYLYELLGRYDTFLPGGSYCYDRKWQCPDLCPGWW